MEEKCIIYIFCFLLKSDQYETVLFRLLNLLVQSKCFVQPTFLRISVSEHES